MELKIVTEDYVNLKQASGCRQRRRESQRVFEVRKGLIMRNFDDMICNSVSKLNLLAFLIEVWSESSDILHPETRMYLSDGFQDRLAVKVVSSDGKYEMRDDEKQMLISTHEEADTGVSLHTAVAIRNGSERVIDYTCLGHRYNRNDIVSFQTASRGWASESLYTD